MRKAIVLVAALALSASTSAAPAAAAAPKPPTVVVLKGGSRYVLSRPYEVRGSQARLPLANGSLVSIPVTEIDLEATRLAAKPPTPTPPPTTGARPKSMSITLTGAPSYSGSSYSGSQAPGYGGAPSGSGGGSVHVRGYTRSDGTYVPPHTRSAPGRGRKK